MNKCERSHRFAAMLLTYPGLYIDPKTTLMYRDVYFVFASGCHAGDIGIEGPQT